MSKFEKLPIAKDSAATQSEIQIISGGKAKKAAPSTPSNRYAKFLENVPSSTQSNFDRQSIQSVTTEIRKEEKNDEATKKLDEERRQFVVALFKK